MKQAKRPIANAILESKEIIVTPNNLRWMYGGWRGRTSFTPLASFQGHANIHGNAR
jgi:hypothetical protein